MAENNKPKKNKREGKFGVPPRFVTVPGKQKLMRGHFEALPESIREVSLQMRDDPTRDSDWRQCVDVPHGDLYFVARTFDDENMGTIVVCRVVAEIEWGDWS